VKKKKKGGCMNTKKIIGIALIVVGAVMLFFSNYIAEQVASGKMQIQEAQGKVDSADSLFSQTKYTKPIGNVFTGSAQKKIDAGQSEVNKYESMSNNLKIGGIVLILIGVIVLFVPMKRKS
jgi:uncharacterized protein YjeT (DUF2065 family)